MISKILLLLCVTFLPLLSWAADDLQNDITDTVQELIPDVESDNELDYVNVAKEVQFWVFVFVGIIAVAYIIYIGAKLLWAPGNMEQMTSAMKSLVYIVL